MNAVLECVRRKAALSIYVQKNSPIGLPSDLDFIDAETGFEPEPDTVQYWSALDREVFSYHGEHKPRMNADIIFLRAAR
ncbi:hypothetical protein AWB80_01303 [Caballeronia pedi]|uniref:Uncharacterized protein n=2 Tax=Caballeronia pedi TaxID=1777141 RepID=A0A157ZUA9_9BURK|nr:hypothetical protein AWB80_01303 [Caballeronia pedi]